MRAEITDLKEVKELRKAQEAIHEVWTERGLVSIAKTAMDCARQRFAMVSIRDKEKVSS